ncbi:MAG: HD domain-containing protein [Candidatus Pacebacteria bacterium]|nr:HD domain-containing protein [Candidatus Paceibacterota bacterium]
MNDQLLTRLKEDFERFLDTFRTDGKKLPPLLQLKADHSYCVAQEARAIGKDLHWPEPEQNTAEALGLLHDCGRFPQFADSGTFSDSDSVDHGELGWLTVRQTELLKSITQSERSAILNGIRYHNRRHIPASIAPCDLPWVRLIRDADKLDIFRVVLEGLELNGFKDLPTMLPNISLDRSPSPTIIRDIQRHNSGAMHNIKSLGDFLLMQMSWIYDINYAPTVQAIIDRRILTRLARHIDSNAESKKLIDDIRRTADEQAREPSTS